MRFPYGRRQQCLAYILPPQILNSKGHRKAQE